MVIIYIGLVIKFFIWFIQTKIPFVIFHNINKKLPMLSGMGSFLCYLLNRKPLET